MTGTRGVAIVVLIAVAGLAIAPLATAGFSDSLAESAGGVVIDGDGDAGEDPVEDDANHGENEDEDGSESAADNGSSPGTNVTEFMESSAAETETTVETGLFNASYNNADDESRETIVTDRAETIEDRIADLEDEKNELKANEDEMSSAAYNARMTRLTVQISSLENSIEAVEHRAGDLGLNMSGLDKLRSSADDLTGPSVVETATNLVSVDMPSSFSDGVRDQVNESVPSPDLGDVSSPNVTGDSGLPTDGLSTPNMTDDTLPNTTSSELEPDDGEIDELVGNNSIGTDELEDERVTLDEAGDNESVIDETVLDEAGDNESAIDETVLDEAGDNESAIDETVLDEDEEDESALDDSVLTEGEDNESVINETVFDVHNGS